MGITWLLLYYTEQFGQFCQSEWRKSFDDEEHLYERQV